MKVWIAVLFGSDGLNNIILIIETDYTATYLLIQ
jgi:hypothetical protein